jgi:hypothetical protein
MKSTTEVEFAGQRRVLCRLVIDMMRTLHEHYAPTEEPFGKRLESIFIGMTLVLGQIEGRPFSVGKTAAFMGMPRTTVIRKLEQLHRWGLLHREGLYYLVDPHALNSAKGVASYRKIRDILQKANDELSVLDNPPRRKPRTKSNPDSFCTPGGSVN